MHHGRSHDLDLEAKSEVSSGYLGSYLHLHDKEVLKFKYIKKN